MNWLNIKLLEDNNYFTEKINRKNRKDFIFFVAFAIFFACFAVKKILSFN